MGLQPYLSSFSSMHSNGPYQIGSFLCMDLESGFICLHEVRHMGIQQMSLFVSTELEYLRIYCQMDLFVFMELKHIGVYYQMGFFVCMEVQACLFGCSQDIYEFIDVMGLFVHMELKYEGSN